MQAAGVIAATLLLATSVAQADEVNGKELVKQLFADCDAVLADPSHVLKIGDIYGGAPAAATVDGKVLSVSVPTNGDQTSLDGVRVFDAKILPGGISANCSMTLFGGVFSSEVARQISEEATGLGQALVGVDAVKAGGRLGGPVLLASSPAGNAVVQMLATPDFPPSTTVTVGSSDQFSNITIQRFMAAP